VQFQCPEGGYHAVAVLRSKSQNYTATLGRNSPTAHQLQDEEVTLLITLYIFLLYNNVNIEEAQYRFLQVDATQMDVSQLKKSNLLELLLIFSYDAPSFHTLLRAVVANILTKLSHLKPLMI